MKDILEKLTSYNLFNYLLPGAIFAVIAEHVTRFSFKQQDIIIGAFVYYFIGLVISRVGSLVIEPILKWVGFVRFAEYNGLCGSRTLRFTTGSAIRAKQFIPHTLLDISPPAGAEGLREFECKVSSDNATSDHRSAGGVVSHVPLGLSQTINLHRAASSSRASHNG